MLVPCQESAMPMATWRREKLEGFGGSGFRVWGLGFRVHGSGFRV